MLAIAGCGGGDDDSSTAAGPPGYEPPPVLAKQEVIARSDAVCAEVNAAVGTVGSTSSGGAGEASQIAGLYRGLVERLHQVGTPEGETTLHAQFVVGAENLARIEEQVELAAKREEGEALTGLESQAEEALATFQAAASKFGAETCAEAPAAPSPSSSSESSETNSGGVETGGEEVSEAEVEIAPEEAPVEEESAGGGAAAGGGSEGGGAGSGGGSSGGIGPG